MEEKNKGGRPKKYSETEVLEQKINEYFDMCEEKGKPYTITGLCLYLDVDRVTLLRYEEKQEFCNTIKRAKNKIENYIEEHSITGDLNPTVSIFNLKNNFGWKDKTEVDQNIGNKDNKPFNIDLAHFTIKELKELINNEDKGTD